MSRLIFVSIMLVSLIGIVGCIRNSVNNSKTLTDKPDYMEGTYGFDRDFLLENGIKIVELFDDVSGSMIVLSPDYQGRVLTSSAEGKNGTSFGWINYNFIKSGKINPQFNPVGGEERLWLGPEGGQFSLYFKPGEDQVFKNWLVPSVIDRENFNVTDRTKLSVTFKKETEIYNAAGTKFNLEIERKVRLLSQTEIENSLGISFPRKLSQIVGYQSQNAIKNIGNSDWTKERGLLSIWMLSMFKPSPTTTVFMPYNKNTDGKVVKTDYFGELPDDRITIEDGLVLFKIDGNYRSKIGLPPGSAKDLCGSYDSKNNILTILWYNLPDTLNEYVNSQWGEQLNPYDGDAINAYNDGPTEDGNIMGPFYEIETSSPAIELKCGNSLVHKQIVVHIQAKEEIVSEIVSDLFQTELTTVINAFK